MMTDKPTPLSTQAAAPVLLGPLAPVGPIVKDEVTQKIEVTEEEPYTIKCICNFSDDDGNTIYCETCDTWQHIDCFYPDNRDEAIREDFAHSCAECKPRPLNRQKAIERTLRLKHPVPGAEPIDKKTKRPQSRTTKKKPKPNDLQINGNGEPESKHSGSGDQLPPKKSKPSHRPSHSVSSQAPKRSPSYGNSKTNTTTHPLSPATTPPDLPDDFQIHHYSAGFYSLYNEHDVPDTHNNAFASLAIPTALSRWLREPDAMKQEVGLAHSDVFEVEPSNLEERKPKLEVKDATRPFDASTTLRWRYVRSTSPIDKDVPLIELNGDIGFQKDYCANTDNLWADLSSPLPFVFFHPKLPLYIDTRKEGSLARFVRRSCKPNAQLETYLSGGSDYHFWLVSDRFISDNEQITLPWDFRLEKTVCARWLNLLGLSEDDGPAPDDIELDEPEYLAISNWIDRILSEYGGCACDLDNNCAFARFHRRYIHGKTHLRANGTKKKSRRPKSQAISPTSTGQATNSRAASEGHGDMEVDGKYETTSSRSKPSSRDPTPARQGSLDQPIILTELTDREKRKVQMVEDTFRRMEQQTQPPKKKKRVSDGTANSSSSTNTGNAPKPRSKSNAAMVHGQYVDAATSRSKSNSPASVQSPRFSHATKPPLPQSDASSRSRQSSAGLRPDYCNASVQTDPTEGEWFSSASLSPRPKRRIITLSQRLMSNRQRSSPSESRRGTSLASLPSATAMELDSPSTEQKPAFSGSTPAELMSPTSQNGDVPMADAPFASVTGQVLPVSTPGEMKGGELRVQMPPVPAFDNAAAVTGGVTTPLSASGSIAQSPFAMANLASPFVPHGINGAGAQPSPAKKKLSLSDYKSRRDKVAGKAPGGTTGLKPISSSPEETKVDIIQEAVKTGEKLEDPSPVSATQTEGGS